MRLILLVVVIFSFPQAVAATPKEKIAPSSKSDTIKEADAIKFIQTRLEESTGLRGWKIVLKDTVGTSREFSAQTANDTEAGTINVAKNYPNGGTLRVYVIPKD